MTRIVKKSWGSYRVLAQGKRWKLKLLVIRPHKCTSLQKHFNRAEVHVDLDNRMWPFNFNYVCAGRWHRLGNGSFKDKHFLELQYGQECRESDIVRKKGG